MKRRPQPAIAATLLMTCFVSGVAGATSQGLNWGVNVGDQFDFSVDSHAQLTVWDEDIHIKVVGRDPIPDVVTSWAQVPEVDIILTWDNGTEISPLPLFSGLTWLGGRFCVPVGNFTLLEGLLLDEIVWNSTINFSSHLGFWYTNLTIYDGEQVVHICTSYLQSDGFLASYWMSASNYSVAGSVRHGLPSDYLILWPPMDIIAIGLTAAVVVALAVRRKKHRKLAAILVTAPPLQYAT